jgi:NAD(P)-dependent dehydrogenase (short-subunit alcohol dehydrogenase family)
MADTGVEGRVVIVTGAGAGIGRGLVRHLGSVGAKVVAAEIDPQSLEATVKELEAAGVDCLGSETDVGTRSSIDAMVDATIKHFGKVDGLVNNANAHSHFCAIADVTSEDFDVNFVSGVKGTLWAMQAVYPHMKRAGWGRIVNVGSSAGLVGFKGMAAHGATKEAIRSLTRTAAREWAQDGIVVNVYCPVSMIHHMGEYAPEDFTGQAMDVLGALMPTGSFEGNGDPERDIAPVVAFLLSDASRYLTGQTLTIDGGAYAFA